MDKKKIFLYLSIVGAWIFALADYLLDIKNMFGAGFYESFVGMDYKIIVFSTFSIFAFPFLAYGIRKILYDINLEKLSPFMLIYISTVPVFMHASFFYYYNVVNLSSASSYTVDLLNKFDILKNIFGTLYFVGLGIICIGIFIKILKGRTLYPRWFSIFNPIVGILFLNILKLILPNVAKVIYPLFVPGTILALMMTIYIIYSLREE